MPLNSNAIKVNLLQNILFNKQKCILNTTERLKQQTVTLFKSILY
jgi:hypothetical protein